MTPYEKLEFLYNNYTPIDEKVVYFHDYDGKKPIEGFRVVKYYVANEILKNGLTPRMKESFLDCFYDGLQDQAYHNQAFVKHGGTNHDEGIFDFICAYRWETCKKQFGVVNIYLNAILVRPFEKEQQKEYERLMKHPYNVRPFYIFDSRSGKTIDDL